jgi:nickel/cobalt exporter
MTNTLSAVYFPAAVALGALHALEPGHAKALTASYLIGIKGTKKDSVVLGLSVATTHSIVVVLISAIGLWLGNAAFTGTATEWLERGSGLIAITIGCWMLWRRLFLRKKSLDHGHRHHAPNPVEISGQYLSGQIEIVETPLGERMRFSAYQNISECELTVEIDRDGSQKEVLHLEKSPDQESIFLSMEVPAEPHEFAALLKWKNSTGKIESFNFSMREPEGHDHHENHDHLDDVAHAKAHAETLPEYARTGGKPSLVEIVIFGAAGGMIPCPASITVMLLALSSGKGAIGLVTVLGFSLGLATALVGVGMIVVTGLSKLSETGKFTWITRQAPIISACLVIVSGFFALLIAH